MVVFSTIKGLIDEQSRARAIKREKQKIYATTGECLATIPYGIGIFLALCAPVTIMGLFAWTMVEIMQLATLEVTANWRVTSL